MIEKIKQWAANNPKLAQWIREGGLFVLVSNVITIGKTIALIFLPAAFAWLGTQSCGFPGIEVNLFGVDFTWNIIGYSEAQGGTAYFAAYMVAMFVGEVVNFFIQRGWVFRSKGNILYQGMWYLLAFCVVTVIVNSINCIWIDVVQFILPESLEWLYNIGTTVLNGGISMVVFFIVNKIVFSDAQPAEQK